MVLPVSQRRSHSFAGKHQFQYWHPIDGVGPVQRIFPDPAKGSRHNRGAAVDLTIVRADGAELPMPTGYDDFTERAHRNYKALARDALDNRALLERVMTKHGFVGLPTEWWHFDDANWEQYPVLDIDFAKLRR